MPNSHKEAEHIWNAILKNLSVINWRTINYAYLVAGTGRFLLKKQIVINCISISIYSFSLYFREINVLYWEQGMPNTLL